MRYLKTRRGGRIRFANTEWVVYIIGQKQPAEAGIGLYADKYFADDQRMPLYDEERRQFAYAHRHTEYSECGRPFSAATRDETTALVEAHSAACPACKAASEN